MADLGVILLTYNEERHIQRAIASIAGVAGEIVVVDSFSTDRTVELAVAAGARVLRHPFVNQAQQFQWAMDNADLTSAWIMRLDADEVIEPELAREIADKLPGLPDRVTGVLLNRKHVFMGRFIRHGGRFPLRLLRIWRRGSARVEQRWMDEHMLLETGDSVSFDGCFADVNLGDLSYFTDKHNRYATREALEVLNQRLDLFEVAASAVDASNRQAAIKKFLKINLYNRLGLAVGPLAYFLYRYVLQGGFLDGREGLIYHLLQGFWYRFLVAAKVFELETALRPLPTRQARLAEISRRTGYDLSSSQAP